MKLPRLSLLAFATLLGLLSLFAQNARAQQDVLSQDAPPPPSYAPPSSASPSSSPSIRNETRLSAIEDQMRVLNGRVEQVEFAVRRLDQALQRMQNDNEARLSKIEAAQTQAASAAAAAAQAQAAAQPQPPQQPVPSNPAQTDVAPNGTLGALKLQDGRITGGVNNPQAPALPTAPPDYGLTAQEQYERAFNFLRQADYPSAEQAFKNFIDKNPKDKMIDNAKYWYGETLYVRARFDEAAVAFADAYQENPRGTKAPDSLLKLAMSLGALNKTADACVALNELKTKYKDAPATVKSRAEEQRGRLKCPKH